MKQFIYCFLAAFVLGVSTGRQAHASSSYYYLVNYENPGNPGSLMTDLDYTGATPAGWTKIQGASTAPVYSPAQTIPFTFMFNGGAVTQYKAATTGYLTFDATATTAAGSDNVALPSALLPNNTICVWGMEATNTTYSQINTKVIGTAPNRQLWIRFYLLATPGVTTSVNTYSIVLEETTNKIYVVDQWHAVTAQVTYVPVSLTVGIQYDAQNAVQVSQSPNIAPQANNSSGTADNDYTEFLTGAQPHFDLSVIKGFALNNRRGLKGDPFTVNGKIRNLGSTAVTSMDLNYQVGNETVQTAHLTGLNIGANGEAYSFTHTKNFMENTAGYYSVKVWASNINGNADEVLSNDALTQSVAVMNGTTATKKVLLEEYSTAPCQFCPDGAVVVDNMKQSIGDEFVVAQHHVGFYSDSMTIPEQFAYESAFTGFAPSASIDRLWLNIPNEANIAIGRDKWQSKTDDRFNVATPVGITIDKSYNTATRQVSATVTANFVDYTAPGDMRINLFVTEENVSGTGTGYDQVNYYNTQTGHPYFGKGNPIRGYVNHDVVRMVPSTTWGTSGVIPNTPTPGGSGGGYSQMYSFTLPTAIRKTNIDENEVHLVAFVSYYDQDTHQRDVLNAAEVKLTSISDVAEQREEGTNELSIFPSPATGNNIKISFSLTNETPVSFAIKNVLGQIVAEIQNNKFESAGSHAFTQSIAGLEPGVYYLTMTSKAKTIVQKFIVAK